MRSTPAPQQIRDTSFTTAFILGPFGILWICITSFGFFVIAAHQPDQKPPPLWVSMIFIGIGVFMVCAAIYMSMSAVRYGRSVFDSPLLPAVSGGVLTGSIRIPRPLQYREPIHLRFACLKRVSNGKNSHEEVVWEDRCTLDRFPTGTAVSEIPIYFKMPADALPAGPMQISWRLDAKAKTQGLHYSAKFEIPVAEGSIPADLLQLADPTAAFRSQDPPRSQPTDRHIHFSPLPGGGSRVELLPGRNLGKAVSSMIFGSIFLAIAASLVYGMRSKHSPPPILFPIVFGGMGALSFLAGVRLLLTKTTITTRHGVISIENSIGLGTRRKEIRAADILDITVKIQGTSNNRTFYCLNATRNAPNPLKICGTINDKGDADWLAAEFKQELGVG